MENEYCTRCLVGVEQYFKWQSSIKTIVLCDECCKTFVASHLDCGVDAVALLKYAERREET